MKIFAIDPGNILSAFVIWDTEKKEIVMMSDKMETQTKKYKNKFPCNDLLTILKAATFDICVIEMVNSYGMPVGKEVFDTVRWIGRFQQHCIALGIPVELIDRKDIKMNMCGSTRAGDSNIRQSIVDRYGPPGTKKAPGITYGVFADVWQALAVAITYQDQINFKSRIIS